MKALDRAFQSLFQRNNGFAGVIPDGKTDPLIISEALAAAGLDGLFHSVFSSFYRLYLAFLAEELEKNHSRFRVLPGAKDLVHVLNDDRRYLLGIATGNIEEGARIKLSRAGLHSFFRVGGFGSDSEDRTSLIRIAVERAAQRIHPRTLESVVVIGDTPRDVMHGKAAGARTVAVASGRFPLAELRASGADLAVSSLSPIRQVLDFLGY